jgi:protein-tyrosine phosphatase
MMEDESIKVLFVCLGNICRSPSAESVFRKIVHNNNAQQLIQMDSAGTANYHVGSMPDSRSSHFAEMRGYDLTGLKARQVSAQDFLVFDYIIAMDQHNLDELKLIMPQRHNTHLALMLDYLSKDNSHTDVPDPYYGGDQGFNNVLDLLEDSCEGLLNSIMKTHASQATKE